MRVIEVCSQCGCQVTSGQQLWHDAYHDQIKYTLDEMRDTIHNHATLLQMLREEVYRD